MIYILFNPLAGGGNGKEKAQEIEGLIKPRACRMLDITQLDVQAFLQDTPVSETILLTGGDGTINHFVNHLDGAVPRQQIYYYPSGSGNDFMNDVREEAVVGFVLLNPYLARLPVVEVNGQRHSFINGIGFGIDGFCCQEGDWLRAKGKTHINYAAIAIQGLLGRFHHRSATVTVDGHTEIYRHVWLVPTMNGRYYGGGMKVAPNQNRLNQEGTVSAVVLHCPSKLKTLIVFPGIFKGKHVQHTEMVSVLTGHDVTVRFDRPTPLQIDGETIPDVLEYRVTRPYAQEG